VTPTDPARTWVEHLRAGGSTPWLTWLQSSNRHEFGAEPAKNQRRPGEESGPGRYDTLPGAAQLELVRRLAERADPGPAFTALADRALARSGPGRGRSERPLIRPDDAERATATGVPPADPAELAADELIRPGIGLLADLLLAGADPADPRPPQHATPTARRLPRPWRPRFHLAGAPMTVASVRTSLAASGHVERGRRPEVVILAEPLDVHLAQVWATRVQHGAPVRWRTFTARWAHRDQLPPSAELTRIAAFWAERVGPDRVHVVIGPDARRTTSAVLGLRDTGNAHTDPTTLSPAAVDLLRRLNSVLNVRAGEDLRNGVRDRAVSLLPSLDARRHPPISVPDRHRAWLDARAEALADGLRRGGYPVHGDLDSIAPRHRGRSHPYRPDVLALLLDGCLALAGLRRERE
jgi:hypothetical protein